MPIHRKKENGRIYYIYGKTGKKYYSCDYVGTQKEREKQAYDAAARQAAAIHANRN